MNNKENIPGAPKPTIELRPLLWLLGVLVIAAGIIGLAWYVYPKLQQQGAAIADLRTAQLATENAIKALPVPVKPEVLEATRKQLHEKAQKFERQTAANINAVRKQALEASENAYLRAKALVDTRIQGVETQLVLLESSHAKDEKRVAELNVEIGKLREQVNLQANELLAVRRQIGHRTAIEESEIAQLKEKGERTHKDVESIESGLATHKVAFELTLHHSAEVAPGVTVEIDRANPSFSYVNGWMRVMPEDRTFWLRRKNVNEPLIFYSATDKDTKHFELVLTAMRGRAVKGYLVVPGEEKPYTGAADLGE